MCSSGEKDGCMLLNDVVDGSVGNQAGLNSVRGAEEQSRIPDIRPSESKEFCKKRIDRADAIVWFPGMQHAVFVVCVYYYSFNFCLGWLESTR